MHDGLWWGLSKTFIISSCSKKTSQWSKLHVHTFRAWMNFNQELHPILKWFFHRSRVRFKISLLKETADFKTSLVHKQSFYLCLLFYFILLKHICKERLNEIYHFMQSIIIWINYCSKNFHGISYVCLSLWNNGLNQTLTNFQFLNHNKRYTLTEIVKYKQFNILIKTMWKEAQENRLLHLLIEQFPILLNQLSDEYCWDHAQILRSFVTFSKELLKGIFTRWKRGE